MTLRKPTAYQDQFSSFDPETDYCWRHAHDPAARWLPINKKWFDDSVFEFNRLETVQSRIGASR